MSVPPDRPFSSTHQSLPSRRSPQAELGWTAQWQGGQRLEVQLAVRNLVATARYEF